MPSQPLLEAARKAPAPVLQIAIPVRLIGAILLGLVAILLVALASWSVDDPSLSYATAKPAANWLGGGGTSRCLAVSTCIAAPKNGRTPASTS